MEFKLKKKVSFVLVVALFFSSLGLGVSPISKANATETIRELFYDAINSAPVEIKDDIEEGLADFLYGNPGMEWAAECFGKSKAENVALNFFHNEVQKHIRKSYDIGFGSKEIDIFNSDKEKIGRADLYYDKGDYRYIWEVKPMSYEYSPNKEKGIKQLEMKLSIMVGKFFKQFSVMQPAVRSHSTLYV